MMEDVTCKIVRSGSRAGVPQGNTAQHLCSPFHNIKRGVILIFYTFHCNKKHEATPMGFLFVKCVKSQNHPPC